ncbi:MAG: GIY-YIG nuclease family protein [Bifidobacteriaceae bacterium]|jgi:hypothetical protein|nr:GIY-YIG nuclease family protein [Bifidobacteriaceae bacterium]
METRTLTFNDLLNLTGEEISQTKIRLCLTPSGSTESPIDIFKRNPDEVNIGWFLDRKKNNNLYVGGHAICLVRLPQNPDLWLFTTMKTITKDTGIYNGVGWEGTEWKQFSPFYGRLIVKFHKGPYSFVNASTVMNSIEVVQLLPDIYEDNHFPGYDNVCLPWKEMHRIIEGELMDWHNALANQKGVYVITDKNTGLLYVGSATAQTDMLLQRWKNYSDNGHGGDVELKRIVDEKASTT